MPLPKTDTIWMNGKLVPWDSAQIHVLSHVVHYGSSWFEGIRAYKTKKGTAIFRLQEHVKRLFDSAKTYRAEVPYTQEQICKAICEVVVRNKLESCYIRPLVYRGYFELGVHPKNCPVDVAIAAWTWGTYLGKDAITDGVDVCVSSWQRLGNNMMPPSAKASANYMNSQLVRMEAVTNGYAEGISLDSQGNVSEGSGENIFLVIGKALYTPSEATSILPGITRASVITLAKKMGLEIIEGAIPRGMLYVADEVFFTGTAVEITPVRSVDRITIGNGKVGVITKKIQEKFFSVVETGVDPHRWLTFVGKGPKSKLSRPTKTTPQRSRTTKNSKK